jgi:hypothetical protein
MEADRIAAMTYLHFALGLVMLAPISPPTMNREAIPDEQAIADCLAVPWFGQPSTSGWSAEEQSISNCLDAGWTLCGTPEFNDEVLRVLNRKRATHRSATGLNDSIDRPNMHDSGRSSNHANAWLPLASELVSQPFFELWRSGGNARPTMRSRPIATSQLTVHHVVTLSGITIWPGTAKTREAAGREHEAGN